MGEHTQRGWFTARPELVEGIGYLVVSPEDMVELKVVKFLLQLPNLLSVCSHAGVMIVWLSHDLIDDELRVFADVKPMNPKFSGDAQTIDQRLILCHIVGYTDV
jgi:hypothetical protein